MLNFKKSFLATLSSLFLITLIPFSSTAQVCGTDLQYEKWKQETPNWQELIRTEKDAVQADRRAGKKIIPVVFHVLHTNGVENISNEQIYDAIRILNEDFSKTNPDWHNVRNTPRAPFLNLVADMEMEFVLAKRDPDGNCTNGINRIVTSQHVNASDNVKNLIKWPVDRYINIWVVSTINSGGSGGITLGYSNLPEMRSSTDGIVMRSDCVGSIGSADPTFSRALTHEVGHFFGLYHTFQGGCNDSQGDLVGDTPPVAQQFSNTACNPTNNSCSKDTLYDQWENFMDYSHGCQSMFSTGQKNRVHNVILPYYARRSKLYSAENLAFTGITSSSNNKPIAFFESNIKVVCTGEPVQFFDNSCQGTVKSRTWEFQGADISSSSNPSPIVTYDEPGEYKVKLTVSNDNGTSSWEEDRYIKVISNIAKQTGIHESFESAEFFSVEGIRQLSGAGFGAFERIETRGYSGKSCIKAPISSLNLGSRFVIELPSLNISKMRNMGPKISFMVGYSRRNTANIDHIRIYVSNDCGNTWEQKFERQSIQFASVQGFQNDFKPNNPSDWTRLTYSLLEYQNYENVKIRIEVESGAGNPVYIDDINVSQYFASVNPIENELNVNIYPNPSDNIFNINLTSLKKQTINSVKVYNIEGREITSLLDDSTNQDELNLTFKPRDFDLVNGVYFIKVETSEGILTKRMIFAD